jgi:putative endonuclease
MHFVYILRSDKTGRHYVGSTSNLDDRIHRHNAGKNRSTKAGAPWTLVWSEPHPTREDAYRREMQIKRYKGGEAFKKLVEK